MPDRRAAERARAQRVGCSRLALTLGLAACAPPAPPRAPGGAPAASSPAPGTSALFTATEPSLTEPAARAVSAEDADLQRARAWLDALRQHDVAALGALSSYPFELRETGELRACGPRRSAASAEQLPATLSCLTSAPDALELLGAAGSGGIEALPRGYLPAWARAWRSALGPDQAAPIAYFRRPAAALTLLFVVSAGGVRELWASGFDARAEVALSNRWLAALAQRDLAALKRLTSYPFELRDGELDGRCGTRSARSPAELPRTLDCLLSDATVMRALPADPSVQAGLTRDAEPAGFEGFRQPEQAELWPTWLQLGSADTTPLDLALLVSTTGVRALWKHGPASDAPEAPASE